MMEFFYENGYALKAVDHFHKETSSWMSERDPKYASVINILIVL